MVLHILRALFILLMAAVGWAYITDPTWFWGGYTWMAMSVALSLAVLLVCVDILAPRKKLAIFSGTFFGLLVGVAIAYALSFVVKLLVEQLQPGPGLRPDQIAAYYRARDAMGDYLTMLLGVATCYLSISFILQTKDDFRFV